MRIGVFPLLYLSFLILFHACTPHYEAVSAEIKTYRAGDLRLRDGPKTVYVDVRDQDKPDSTSEGLLKEALAHNGFEIVNSPSEAAYILHVSVMGRGDVDPAAFASLVNAGYGGSSKFSGHGARGVLADALLVLREVPEHKRPSRARMKNAAQRNALDSSQTRVGALLVTGDAPRSEFADALAKELRAALNIASPNTAEN